MHLIFSVIYSPSTPSSLIVANPSHTIDGVGILKDVEKLTGDYGLTVANALDLRVLAGGSGGLRREGVEECRLGGSCEAGVGSGGFEAKEGYLREFGAWLYWKIAFVVLSNLLVGVIYEDGFYLGVILACHVIPGFLIGLCVLYQCSAIEVDTNVFVNASEASGQTIPETLFGIFFEFHDLKLGALILHPILILGLSLGMSHLLLYQLTVRHALIETKLLFEWMCFVTEATPMYVQMEGLVLITLNSGACFITAHHVFVVHVVSKEHVLNASPDLHSTPFLQIYSDANTVFSLAYKFDHSSRSGPKAFVSDYVVTGKDAGTGSLLVALAEAGFLIGLERNRSIKLFQDSMLFTIS
ncbi:hypothetical protein RHMOL_Rhmol04G0137500 [Rhododendron molle]|uniref:Uncharacterized protein n=1 Tax=Rhododendron molle TaxID=49168 RepID=A0ACC0P2L2_RHOML|nr:hypothetical protein RHMOL_Rhmol04G0137500 [Rhododendron molle]